MPTMMVTAMEEMTGEVTHVGDSETDHLTM